MRSLFFYIAVLGFCGGILCRSFFLTGLPLIGFFLLVAALCGVWFLRRQRVVYGLVAVALVAASIGVLRMEFVRTGLPPSLVPLLESKATLEGYVQSDPDVRESQQRIMLKTSDALLLIVAPTYPQVLYGEEIRVEGVITRPEVFDTDGGRVFRYDQYLAKDGVYGVIEDARVEVVGKRQGILKSAFGVLIDLKHHFMSAIESALPEPHASLASGLLLGGKQGLGKELLNAFTVTGLVHIVVLSGYNIMIIAEAVLRATSSLSRRVRVGSSVLVIAAFVLAAGASAAALRAGLMAGIALLARATGRTYDALRALGAAAVVMLLTNPLLLAFDPGFQLSVIATLGLILGTPITEKWVERVKPLLLREVLATTIAAQIAVLPLLLYQTGNLSVVSLLANVLVLPVVPAAMAAAFFAACAALIVPGAAVFFGLPAYAVLGYVVFVVEKSATLPFAQLLIPAFPFVLVVAAYAGMGYVLWRNRAS